MYSNNICEFSNLVFHTHFWFMRITYIFIFHQIAHQSISPDDLLHVEFFPSFLPSWFKNIFLLFLFLFSINYLHKQNFACVKLLNSLQWHPPYFFNSFKSYLWGIDKVIIFQYFFFSLSLYFFLSKEETADSMKSFKSNLIFLSIIHIVVVCFFFFVFEQTRKKAFIEFP